MSRQRAVTVELPEEEYARLEAAAERVGVPPGALARRVLDRYLERPDEDPRQALERLRALRAGLPQVDVVDIVRQGRDVGCAVRTINNCPG